MKMTDDKYFYGFLTLNAPEYYEDAAKGLILFFADALTLAGLEVVDIKIEEIKYQANWDGEVMLYPNLFYSVVYQVNFRSGFVDIRFPLHIKFESRPLQNFFKGEIWVGEFKAFEQVYRFTPEIDFYLQVTNSIKKFLRENLFQFLLKTNVVLNHG